MDSPAEQAMRSREGSLSSLVRSLTDCVDDREGELLKTAIYDSFKEAFYDRLKKTTSRLYRGIPDWEARMNEVFNDTFSIAFEEMKTFKVGDRWDNAECQNVILNWMSKIANNLLLKLARSTKKEKSALKIYVGVQSYDIVPGQDQGRKTYKQTYDKVKFDKFWERLSPMAREILLTCVELGTVKVEAGNYLSDQEVNLLKIKNDLDSCALPKEVKKFVKQDAFILRNTDHLPNDVLDYLKLKYDLTPAAIRKTKQRALEGLRNCKI